MSRNLLFHSEFRLRMSLAIILLEPLRYYFSENNDRYVQNGRISKETVSPENLNNNLLLYSLKSLPIRAAANTNDELLSGLAPIICQVQIGCLRSSYNRQERE